MNIEHGSTCKIGQFTRSINPDGSAEEYPCTCRAEDMQALINDLRQFRREIIYSCEVASKDAEHSLRRVAKHLKEYLDKHETA